MTGAGRLLCLGGGPGDGKSTVGRLVAGSTRAAVVDLDSVTTALVEAVAAAAGEAADLDAPRWAALRPARYACLAAVCGDCLAAGVDVVAVAPFTRESADGAAWTAWGRALGARTVTTVWLDLDPGVAASRRAARGLPRDLAGSGRGAHDAGRRPEADLVLDASADPQTLAGAVVAAWPRG